MTDDACLINPADVEMTDGTDGDQTHASVWCDTHAKYEWHWLATADLPA